MNTRRREGNALVMLVALLAIGGGAGWWNYQRNVALEEAEFRPFRGYTLAELEQLGAAYGGKRATDSERYEAVVERRASARDRAYFDEQVREFERVQRTHAQKQTLRNELAGSQATVKQIEEELRRRAAMGDGVRLFLKRLLTLP